MNANAKSKSTSRIYAVLVRYGTYIIEYIEIVQQRVTTGSDGGVAKDLEGSGGVHARSHRRGHGGDLKSVVSGLCLCW